MKKIFATFLLISASRLQSIECDTEMNTTINDVKKPMAESVCREIPIGYALPAAYDLGKSCSWFLDASFIYWNAEILGSYQAQYAILNDSSPGVAIFPTHSFPLSPDFTYHPGFKIELGFIFSKEWSVAAEYTWLRSKTSLNESAPGNTSGLAGTGVWIVDDWFQQITAANKQSLSGTHLSSKWKMDFDLFDLNLSRPYYQAHHLVIRPLFGLRGLLIKNSFDVTLTQAPSSEADSLLPQPIVSQNYSKGWAIGPQTGFSAECLLPRGWRLEGHAGGGLLATTFTKVYHKEEGQNSAVEGDPYIITQNAVHTLNLDLEIGLGIGWGHYFCNKKGHFDVLATYDFLDFFGQNMVRRMLDNYWSGMETPAGDLYLQGLTLKGRIDF